MKKYLFLFLITLSFLLPLSAQKNDPKISWTECESLKSVYVDSGIFEHIGFAVPAGKLENKMLVEGIKYHGSAITLENETKPDTIMQLIRARIPEDDFEDFVSSKGLTIKVPKQSKLNFSSLDSALAFCKNNNMKLRGHVLVWHNQTPESFFCQNFDSSKPFVTKEEMDARQEWYIKSVLEHGTEWEKANNNNERIIYAWDVVNEALSDSPSGKDYLRDASSSNWFAIYKNDEFIVNAFRYANLYAPKEVLLAYNDYMEFVGEKHKAYLKLIDTILAAKNDAKLPARIDIIGMQSHNTLTWPTTVEYETAIKNFIKKGLDINITELDITGEYKSESNIAKADQKSQKRVYNTYFKLYKKYRKTETKNGISGITFWGTMDETSWRAMGGPLLFSNYQTKPAYYGVIEAAKK